MATAVMTSSNSACDTPTTQPFGTPAGSMPATDWDQASVSTIADGPRPTHSRPKRSWFRWVPTDREQLAATEACILCHLKERFLQRFVAGLNTVSSIPSQMAPGARGAAVQRHIVLLHGFGGGLAMWVPNFNFLVDAVRDEKIVTQIHAIDMPGFARSQRHPMVSFKSEKDAMDYMTGHLREWFAEMGIDKPRVAGGSVPHVDLVGHSFGAYVCATFAHRYPSLVRRAVLCDPWGVPPKPADIESNLPFKYRMLLKTFYAGNPFSVLRGAGPWGPSLLPSVRQDFADRWGPIVGDPNIFFDYIFHANAAHHPTGEQAFQACCTGPVYARRPLQAFVPSIPSSVDLSVIYGARTWMDKSAGVAMMATAQENRGTRSQNTYAFVQDAGHQVNTDNIEGFNAALARELRLACSV
jgi:pimeloyl-ACP methyl ester carboxylesterase